MCFSNEITSKATGMRLGNHAIAIVCNNGSHYSSVAIQELQFQRQQIM